MDEVAEYIRTMRRILDASSGETRRGPQWAGVLLGAGVLIVATTAVALASHADSDVRATSSTFGSPAQWRPCPDIAKEVLDFDVPRELATFDCASVKVPRDWDSPEKSGTFELSMVRVRSTNQKSRVGSLVLNPGGPGGSGIEAAIGLGIPVFGLPEKVLERFDVVGFDPRGVGRSNAVSCLSGAELDKSNDADSDPDNAREMQHLIGGSKSFWRACEKIYGGQLSLFSTNQTARDLEAIRSAIGDDKLTYLGYSYGTQLGATYASMFPDRVRALVLDGAVDPRQSMVATAEGQAKGFEKAFNAFSKWCGRTPANCAISKDPRGAVASALKKAERTPVLADDARAATPGWLFTALLSSLYDEQAWPAFATAVRDLSKNKPDTTFAIADSFVQRAPSGRYGSIIQSNTVINCADSESGITVAGVKKLHRAWRTKYPTFGGAIAVSLLSCALWTGKRDVNTIGTAKGAPPILIVGTTGDPATPVENARVLADTLGTGRVVTFTGEGHTAYPQLSDSAKAKCLNNAVTDYLLGLKVPKDQTRCR